MYDKLGDLLKAALEKGEIPKPAGKSETNAGTAARYHDFKAQSKAGTDVNSHGFKAQSKDAEADSLSAPNDCAQTKNKTETRCTAMRGGQSGGTKGKIERILRAKDKKNIGEVIKSENGAERARPFEALPDRIRKACETLGVKVYADASEIRRTYRKKLKLFHPDSNAENETVQRVAHKKTEEIVEAYNAIREYKKSLI